MRTCERQGVARSVCGTRNTAAQGARRAPGLFRERRAGAGEGGRRRWASILSGEGTRGGRSSGRDGTGERRTPAAAGPAGGTAPCSARSIAGAMDRGRGKKKSGAHTCCLVGRGEPNDLEAREDKGETGGGAGVRSVGAWSG